MIRVEGAARAGLLSAALILVSASAVLISVVHGAHGTTLIEALQHLLADDGSNTAFAVRELRLPRALCAVGVGAALALSGALIQIVTRNPLGDPGLTGVTAGAAFGVALTLTTISPSPSLLILAGIFGGLTAATMTYALAHRPGGWRSMEPLHIILAGISVAVFFLAATSAVMILARSSMQTLYIWMVGSFINRGWAEFNLFWPIAGVCALAALALAPVLKILQFDDSMAASMGVSPGLGRLVAGALSIVLAAVCVAVAGPIGFVGFVAPHLARLCLGQSTSGMAMWLCVSALVGAALLSAADMAARLAFAGRVPAGALITILGAIVFLILARKGLRHAG